MNFNWQGKVILVVEDEPANYLFIEKIIESTEAKVLHAENGSEAIELVKNDPSIDVVLMDIQMPGLDGFDTTNAIKIIKPNLPVIMQTCSSELNIKKFNLRNFDDFVQKPINITKLLAMIDKHISISYSYEQ